MDVIEKIRQHPLYLDCYEKLEKAEDDRIFCCHQMPHLLDVARIAYIQNLEGHLGFKKEIIYAAALLHDIGKYQQYEDGTPHEQAGARIAEKVLADIEFFTKEEKAVIIQSILEHRRKKDRMSALGRILYESDKLSRACYACPARHQCNWSSEKKNRVIMW